MRRYLVFLLCLMLAFIGISSAHAAVSVPTVYCDGENVSSREIVQYDVADGTLTIKWDKQTDAAKYYYKCVGLDERPDFNDTTQGNRGTVISEKTVTSNTTSSRKFTVSTTKMKKYDYLKIAIAVYDSDGNQRWCNFGVELTNSDLVVKAPSLFCDGDAVDSREIYDYDLANGSLIIKWTPQSAAESYVYKIIGLNEVPDFYDDNQGSRGTVIAEGTVTSNTTSKCKITLTTSKMKSYSHLKVAVAAYDSNGKAYWKNIGVKLAQETKDSLTLSKTSLSFTKAKSSSTITVSNASSYTVSYPTANETNEGKKWLTVSKSGSTITVSARANYGASSRSETITVTSSDGQTATIQVTQQAGYSAPTASIKIGSASYNSGDTYGPLANGGKDVLWLTVAVKNAQRIYVESGNVEIGHCEVQLSYSSTQKEEDCSFTIPKGLTPGTYTFTVYVSNSSVKDDQWSQAITPITLNVRVVGDSSSSEDPYPPRGTTLVAVAQSQIGYTGSADNSNQTGANVTTAGNWTKYGAYTGVNNDQWCASFVSWCGNQAGISAINKSASASPKALCKNYETKGAVVYFNDLNKTQKTNHPYLEESGIKKKRSEATPAPGDLIFFRWKTASSSTTFSHVGIVSKVSNEAVFYIDGNDENDVVSEKSISLTDTRIAAYCKVTGTFDENTTSHQYALLGDYIDYIPGQDYFTESKTKECTGNNSVSGGTCRSIKYDNSWQCAAFAKYVEQTIYHCYGSYLDGKETGLLSSSAVTVDTLKDLIYRAGVGANVRAGSSNAGHSMIVTGITESGFDVIHANWNNDCAVTTKTFTWESFKSWLNSKNYGIEKIRVHNPGYNPEAVEAGTPVFNGYTALTVTDYDLARGSLTISWSASNASQYSINAILLNEEPVVGDETQADRAVKTVKKGIYATNSITMSADDLRGGQYLKFAVGAAASGESSYHWSWIGFKLYETSAFGDADMVLPASLVTIENEAFYGMPVSVVYCPDSIKTIGARAFANCKSLRQIRIPAGVSSIDSTAFDGCTNLTIYGTRGSTAESFAANHGFAFVAEDGQGKADETKAQPTIYVTLAGNSIVYHDGDRLFTVYNNEDRWICVDAYFTNTIRAWYRMEYPEGSGLGFVGTNSYNIAEIKNAETGACSWCCKIPAGATPGIYKVKIDALNSSIEGDQESPRTTLTLTVEVRSANNGGSGKLNLAQVLASTSNANWTLTGDLNGDYDQGRYGDPYRTCHDFKAKEGTELRAPLDGEIVCTQIAYKANGTTPTLISYGNRIEFKSSDGKYIIIFGHLSAFKGVSTTDSDWITATARLRSSEVADSLRCDREVLRKPVKAGDVIGYTGDTGHSLGAHLHAEVYSVENGNKKRLYPCAFFKNESIVYITTSSVDPNY